MDPRKLKPKTTKLLEGNMGDNICNFVVGRDFLYTQETKGTDHKIIFDKLDAITIKCLKPLKDTIKEIKRQTMDWEKILIIIYLTNN